jgi:signal transduction histidine kinase
VQFENELKQRLSIEKELGEKYIELETAQRVARIGSWSYTFENPEIKATKEFYSIFHLEPDLPHNPTELRKKILPEDLPTVTETLEKVRQTGGGFDVQYRFLAPNGEIVYIHSRGMTLQDDAGKVIGMQGFSQDVTAIKTAEHILELRAQELERINKELEFFAYAASHDLQEPLRKLRAFGDRLSQRYADKLDEQGQDYIRRMDNASARMQSLIDDLLTYSRLSRNKDEKQPVDLNVLIKELVSDLDETIIEKNIEVEIIDSLPTLPAVPSQMRQLFQNLLSNAFKFTREGVKPKITLQCSTSRGRDLPWKNDLQGQEKYYVIEVKDNGIGFDSQFAEKIFAMFQRLHGRNEYPGSGIGLALCKKIVENHNGIMRAEGTEGTGSIFTIVLPVKKN